jgi:phosphopantothenoylcysteine decarboxylase / phosphopantothenate---cysteine ligase
MRTRLDAVRYVQNRSSGRMGLALVKEAARRSASPTVLLGPVDSKIETEFAFWKPTRFESPVDYQRGLEQHFSQCDVFFSIAAVLDFECLPVPGKWGREAFGDTLTLPIRPVPDFAAWAGQQKKPHQKVIAFAAEIGPVEDMLLRAERKRLKKNADAIVVNPVAPDSGPESATNEIWILREGSPPKHLGKGPKTELAKLVLDTLFPESARQ